MKEPDLFSVINIINKLGEKYAIYNKDKNKIHDKKIKKLLKAKHEMLPEVFLKRFMILWVFVEMVHGVNMGQPI